MKVLNVLTSPLVYDGISMSILNYFNNIDNQKIQMDFVAPSTIEEIENQIRGKGGKVHILKERKKHPLKYIKKLSVLIKENKYDIVQAHGSSAILCLEMIAAKRAECKIRIAHCHNTKCDHRLIDTILRPVFYRTYTHGFACGEEAGKWLFKNRKFEIINNGKNIEEYEYNEKIRNQMRKKYSLSNYKVIGHVGSFNYQKNHNFLIDIFYELKNRGGEKYKLVLLGGGELKSYIEEKVKKLKLQDDVIFVGRTKEVANWLQAMDIMVLPSRFEGFPLVLVEWQIAGIPCIVSDKVTPAVKMTDLVQFASIEDKPEEWANKIKKIELKDRKESKEKIIKEIKDSGFDIKEETKKLEKIYEKIYENSNRR